MLTIHFKWQQIAVVYNVWDVSYTFAQTRIPSADHDFYFISKYTFKKKKSKCTVPNAQSLRLDKNRTIQIRPVYFNGFLCRVLLFGFK